MPGLKTLFSKLSGKTGFYEVNKTPEQDEPIVHRKLTRAKNSTSHTGRKTSKRRHSIGGKRKHSARKHTGRKHSARKHSARKHKRSHRK
jgi:hypothetical protein